MATRASIDGSALRERLEVLRERHGVPGASLAVLADGEVTAATAGVLNLGTGVEATTDSLFQIGSITKVWTTTVAMLLVEDGLLDLDAPVRRYLPSFRVADPEVSEGVTIRHLLTHSSGIDGDNFADTGRGDDALEKYVETCAGLRQVHPLGATTSYCNTGFSLLGRVLEVVTDAVWDEVVRTRLFEPLGLTHTATLPEDVLRYRAAIGHIRPGDELVPAPAWGLPRTAGPPGGICSTATEVLEFARLHLDGGRNRSGEQVVGSDSVRAMQTPQMAVPSGGIGPFSEHFGLSWAIYDWGGRKVIGHDGGTIGQAAFLRVVPDAGVAIALLTNGGNVIGFFQEVSGPLLEDLAGVEGPAPVGPPDDPAAYDPAPYLGVFEREGARIEVVARDGAMVAIQTVTGLGSEMTPEPFELPLAPYDPSDGLFLTRHPVAPETWLPVKFLVLSDGSDCLHIAGRATPKIV